MLRRAQFEKRNIDAIKMRLWQAAEDFCLIGLLEAIRVERDRECFLHQIVNGAELTAVLRRTEADTVSCSHHVLRPCVIGHYKA